MALATGGQDAGNFFFFWAGLSQELSIDSGKYVFERAAKINVCGGRGQSNLHIWIFCCFTVRPSISWQNKHFVQLSAGYSTNEFDDLSKMEIA
jgi:hypothetical protein